MQEVNSTPASPAMPGSAARLQARLLAGVVTVVLVMALCVGAIGGVLGSTLLAQPVSAQGISSAVAATDPASTLQSAVISASGKVSPAVVSIRTDQGLGSGVIYDASGLILTNAHVVDGASSITVGLSDGRHFTGTVRGTNAGFDLAVVKINGQNLPAAPLGDSSSLQVGEFAIAIGNPYGFDHTVTVGVVSGINRPISEGQGSYNQAMLQTDAAINPGNSGGPLVDLQGNVIGINTLIAAPQGVPAQGMGFAIPVNTAKRLAPQLAQGSQVAHSGQPYLGMGLSDVTSAAAAPSRSRFGYFSQRPAAPAGVDHGALVGQVASGGPGAQAGVQTGDVITRFDGKDIYNSDELLQTLVLHQPGDKVQVGIVRGGQSLTLTLTIGEAPAQ